MPTTAACHNYCWMEITEATDAMQCLHTHSQPCTSFSSLPFTDGTLDARCRRAHTNVYDAQNKYADRLQFAHSFARKHVQCAAAWACVYNMHTHTVNSRLNTLWRLHFIECEMLLKFESSCGCRGPSHLRLVSPSLLHFKIKYSLSRKWKHSLVAAIRNRRAFIT